MTTSENLTRRFEDHKLLIGAGSFVADIQLPGMLHAAIVRSPHAHALIRDIDVSRAQKLPGVAAVVTGRDLAGVLGEIPSTPAGSSTVTEKPRRRNSSEAVKPNTPAPTIKMDSMVEPAYPSVSDK